MTNEAPKRALLSRAWSGASMIAGANNMLLNVKTEIPDDPDKLKNMIQARCL